MLKEMVNEKPMVFIATIIVAILIIFSLISLGWIFGSNVPNSISIKNFWDWLVGTTTIFGGIAALFAAYIAYQALNTWKLQFDYSERFKAIVSLEKAHNQFLDSFLTYYKSKQLHQRDDNTCIIKKTANLTECYDAWLNNYNDLEEAYQWAKTFLSIDEVNFLERDIVNNDTGINKMTFNVIKSFMLKYISSNKADDLQAVNTMSSSLKKELLNIRRGIKI